MALTRRWPPRPGAVRRGRRTGPAAIDQVEADLVQFARLLVTRCGCARPWPTPLPPEPKRALLTELGQGRLDQASVELLATVATRQRVRPRTSRCWPGSPPWPPSPPPTRPASWNSSRASCSASPPWSSGEHRVRSALTNPGLPVENKRALSPTC